MTELERIADSLARSTQRAVSIHDRTRRLLAFSSHAGVVDEVRKESILSRRGPARGFAWAQRFGVEEAEGPVRIPPNPELDMEARICTPIRFDGRLLGFMWLVDPDASLPEDSLDLVRSAADAAGLAIQSQELLEQIDRGRGRELLRDLLSDQADVRSHAVDDLIESGLLVPGEKAVVLVVRPICQGTGMAPHDTGVRAAVERALTRSRDGLALRQALQLVRPDHGVLLMACSAHQAAHVREFGEEVQEHMTSALRKREGWESVVGIGDPQTDLDQCHTSYAQARKTAELCSVLRSAGPVARWSDLGVYQTLLQLPISQVDMSALHPGLVRLFGSRDSAVWLQTLECYLDLGCDARGAAETLFINRSSLYHRIHRIEEIAEVDLSRGDDRLALHLGLKLARLSGLLEAPAG